MIYIKEIDKRDMVILERDNLAQCIFDMATDEPCTVVVVGKYEDVTFIAEQNSIPSFLVVLNSGVGYMDIIPFEKSKILERLDKMEDIKRAYTGIVNIKIELDEDLDISVD